MKVNILGTEYTIQFVEDVIIDCENMAGATYFKEKVIEISNKANFQEETIRHEIIHAFLFESGLHCNSEWATNEEMVDWFALQMPKIMKTVTEINKLQGGYKINE